MVGQRAERPVRFGTGLDRWYLDISIADARRAVEMDPTLAGLVLRCQRLCGEGMGGTVATGVLEGA